MSSEHEHPAPQPNQPPPALPVLISIRQTIQSFGLSRSGVYRLLNTGKIEAKKHGARTLIVTESVYRFVAALPSVKSST